MSKKEEELHNYYKKQIDAESKLQREKLQQVETQLAAGIESENLLKVQLQTLQTNLQSSHARNQQLDNANQ